MTRMCHRVLLVVWAALLLGACSEGPFDEYAALLQIQAQPVQLDGEQVTLTGDQITCGERDDLWVVLPEGAGRSMARLTDRGRALGFSDNIHMGDPGISFPYGQIRGKFPLRAANPHMKDVDERTKIVDARIQVVMDGACLKKSPPTLMGLHHGEFTTLDNPTFEFRLHGEEWRLAGLVH